MSDILEKAGMLHRANGNPLTNTGYLSTQIPGAIIEVPFNYGELANNFNYIENTLLPNIEITRTIKTPNKNLAFTPGAHIRLADGTEHKVYQVQPFIDGQGAQYSGSGSIKYLILVLRGG